eukprot:TRINITY_DN835_c0_g2_i1.p1 TRINITY_DN835_c0_g2~~TRINITY_DN835_c0_g2_i1.p1  ORF type:complete len:1265 (+),score=428.36 TRINITY_DN835_c0_g2_i1:206-4000(+)
MATPAKKPPPPVPSTPKPAALATAAAAAAATTAGGPAKVPAIVNPWPASPEYGKRVVPGASNGGGGAATALRPLPKQAQPPPPAQQQQQQQQPPPHRPSLPPPPAPHAGGRPLPSNPPTPAAPAQQQQHVAPSAAPPPAPAVVAAAAAVTAATAIVSSAPPSAPPPAPPTASNPFEDESSSDEADTSDESSDDEAAAAAAKEPASVFGLLGKEAGAGNAAAGAGATGAAADDEDDEPTVDESDTSSEDEAPKPEQAKAEEAVTTEKKPEENPTADEPKKEEKTADEPTKEEKTADEPTKEEKTADEPTKEEKTADEPTKEEKTADEPKKEEKVKPAVPTRRKPALPSSRPPSRTVSEGQHPKAPQDGGAQPTVTSSTPAVAVKPVPKVDFGPFCEEISALHNFLQVLEDCSGKQVSCKHVAIERGEQLSVISQDYAYNCMNTTYSGSEEFGRCLLKLGSLLRTVNTVLEPNLKRTLAEVHSVAEQLHSKSSVHQEACKKVVELQETLENANNRLQAAQKRGKVDLMKLAELQQERDTLSIKCKNATDDAIRTGTNNRSKAVSMLLLSMCDHIEAYQEFFQTGQEFMQALKPDLAEWRKKANTQKSELEEEERAMESDGLPNVTNPLFATMYTEEKNYIEDINYVAQDYLTAIMNNSSLFAAITLQDVVAIFGNINAIADLSVAFVKTMSSASSLSECFLQHANAFCSVYTKYVSNYVAAQKKLDECKRTSKQFRSFLKTIERQDPVKGNLSKLLSLPLVRVRQFSAQLESRERNVMESAEFEQFVERLHSIDEIAEEAMTTHMTGVMIKTIVGLPEEVVRQQRKFIMQSTFMSREHGPLNVFLFNDIAIFAKKTVISLKKDKFQYLLLMDLHILSIKEAEDISPTMKCCLRIADPKLIMTLSCDSEQQRTQFITQVLRACDDLLQKRVFKVPLQELMESKREHGHDVPTIVEVTIKYLQNYVMTEGLFRLSGSASEIEAIREAYDFDKPVTLDGKDPHVVAGVLKLFLRSLPEPLLTFKLHDSFAALAELPPEELNEGLRGLVFQLPCHNQWLLQHLMHFLNVITSYSEANMMHSNNLSIVFTPVLLRQKNMMLQLEAGLIATNYLLVKHMIDHYAEIFDFIEKGRQILHPANAQPVAAAQAPVDDTPPTSAVGAPGVAADKTDLTLSLREIVKQGNLVKKGAKRRNWTNRWFIVKKGYLYYFKRPQDHVPKGIINLENSEVHEVVRGNKKFCLSVLTGGREYYLSAKTVDEQHAWYEALKQCS